MNGSHEPKFANKELLSVEELAGYLGISVASVRRMVERRSIRFYRLARHLRFRRSDVEAYLATRLVEVIEI